MLEKKTFKKCRLKTKDKFPKDPSRHFNVICIKKIGVRYLLTTFEEYVRFSINAIRSVSLLKAEKTLTNKYRDKESPQSNGKKAFSTDT